MKVKNLIQKIICLVTVFVMIAGNFINPVISIAEELNNNETSVVTDATVDSNSNATSATNTDNGEEGGQAETEAQDTENDNQNADDKDAKIEEIEAAFDAAQERENEQTGSTEAGEQENLSENSNQQEEPEETEEPEEPAQTRNIKSSAPVLRGGDLETNSDKIEDRITPDKKDEIVEKTKNDAYEINKFQTEFVSGAIKDENGNLVWTAESSASGHEFRFRINYALSGLKEHPAEAIKITIPKQILRNRAGDLADKYEMSLPTNEEYDGTTEFAYIENEDYIVIYNPEPVEAAVNGYVEVAYKTNQSTTQYRDYDKTNTDLITNGGTASDPFNAVITVKTTVNNHEDILAKKSDDKNVFIDTTVEIQYTQKYQPTIYREWNNSWMAEVPEDKDDYYYLEWKVVTFVQNGTQPYTFSLQDTVTNLTDGTSAEDYQFVGYKLSGETLFSDKNVDLNPRNGSPRTDYVLTCHKKSTFSNINYKLKNTVKATVFPFDEVDPSTSATGSNIFSWSAEFSIPTGKFNLYKYGNSSWDNGYWNYANYNLDKMQNGEVDELDGFKYSTNMVGYAYPWTLKEGGSSSNPEDYGYNPVNYDTWDDTLYLERDENPMNYEDYYLDYFTYSISNSDGEYDDFYNKFNATTPVYADDEIITFYGKFAENQNWVEIGTVNLKTREITFDDTYIAEMTTSKVVFKQGVHATGWRYKTTNKHYHTGISVVPYCVLTNSNYVMEKIADKDRIEIKNIVKTHITDYKDETIFDAERAAIDYARVTYYNSYINKTVTAGSNNVVKRKYNVSWKVIAYETATNGNGDTEYISQDTGRFYDLIPAGGEIDVKSIQVQNENRYLNENEYSCETIPDYKNSGRTLLIINIDVQAQYYTVYYKTVHSWESMHDFGRNVLNPVAYETGNEKIAKGFPDDGGSLCPENKVLFSNLDSTTDANKFLYDEQPHTINALTATISGLFKKVKSEKDTDYKYDTKVESGGRYSYQLRYQNTFLNKAKDLIIYDSLENFKIVDSEAGTVKTSGWRGTLQSIDLSQIRKKGIEPIIYISTQDNVNLEEHGDLTDSSIWTKATITTNLFEAKAIAIDLRKDVDGNDFILEPGESISAILNMKAPDQISEEAERNPYAYNNVYLNGTLLDEQEEITDFFIHQDYTQIKYYIMADVPVVKVNEEDKNEKIKGITFKLYGTSNYGTDVEKYVTSDKNGKIVFKDIEFGEYTLQEYETNDDWFIDYAEHIVVIDRNGIVYIDGEIANELVPFKVTNKPRIHADVTITKKNLVTKAPIEGVKFKLFGTSNYGNEVLTYKVSDANGKVKFDGLEYGTYDLIEVSVPEWYILSNDKWRVTVDENGNYNVEKKTSTIKPITKYSHTSNIDDSGYALGKDTGKQTIDTVSIPGSSSLNVTVYYGTYTDYYDWVSVYGGNSTPTASNYNSSISGKLGGGQSNYNTINVGGYENVCRKWTGTVDGDTVKFYYTGGYGAYMSECYGYYAIITSDIMETENIYESIYNKGSFDIYNEPYHSFSFIKKDEYSSENIAGAKFRLYGISDYGNITDKQATSSPIGFVEFKDLESGTYILQETYVPEVTDELGNTISYVLNDNKYIVNIEKDKAATINGINRNEYGEYVFYNKRNKGQITITKKWVDQKDNDQRTEPVVHISNEKPNAPSRVQYLRNNQSTSGWDAGPLYYVNSDYHLYITGAFKRNTDLSEDEVKSLGAKRIDIEYSDEDAKYKIYGWIDPDGNFWWWSNADVIKMTDNSNRLFNYMTNVQEIDLSGINTDEVTDMSQFFRGCEKLRNISGSTFNTSNVTDMSYMFSGCSRLVAIDVSSFNTSNVTNMECMFDICQSLVELDLSSFDTRNVTSMKYMFGNRNLNNGCMSLIELDLSSFDTSNVTDMRGMFLGCTGLTELNISSFNTSNVKDMSAMFERCCNLRELDLSSFNTSNVTRMAWMFADCSSLTELDLSSFDTGKVTSMESMFGRNISYSSGGCSSLVKLDLSSFNTENVTDMKYMFYGCSSLTELNLSSFNVDNVTTMNQMFYKCSSLPELDLSSFSTSNLTNMAQMFYECSSLLELDLSSFNTSNVVSMYYMFYNCSGLIELNLNGLDASHVTTMSNMFSGCSSLAELNLSGFTTNDVTQIGFMFNNCVSLTALDLSGFNTSNVTGMTKAFYNCNNLVTIYAGPDFVTSKVTSSNDMFTYDTRLVGGNGTRYSSSYTNKTYARIDKSGQKGYFTEKTTSSGELNDDVFVADKCINILRFSNTKTQIEYTYLNSKIDLLAPGSDSDIEENDSSEIITFSSNETNYDDEGNEIHWVKDGDVWTYTFYVDDPYSTWYVWEDGMDGYETNFDIWNPGIVQNQNAEIINYTMQNKRRVALKFGNLSITKTIIQRTENEDVTLTPAEDDTKFMFNVSLNAPEGEENKISGVKVFGDYIFNDGVCDIPIKDGETIVIEGIPDELTYEISEKPVDGYETFLGATGTIAQNETSEIHAINYKYKADGSISLNPGENLTSFKLIKEAIGNAELDDLYYFEIALEELNENRIYTLSNGQTFTSDSVGSANVSVSLKNNESITVQNIPVGSKYKVFEYAGDYVSSYVIKDANNAGLINNTAKSNTKENKDLSTNFETADEGEEITITFTNKIEAAQNLKVCKVVTDSEDTNSYMFDIEFANLEPGTSFNSTVGKLDEEDGKIEITIYLAGGEEAEFYNIPVGTTYVVKELASTAIASYTVTDENGGNNIVSASKANTAAKKALSTERETVNQGEEVTITFTNDIVNQEPDSVSTSLGVTKNVVDEDGETVENCDETFTFELTTDKDTNPMPENTTVSVTGNGTASFGTITFTQTGTYTYTVIEKAGTNEECTYDDTVYTIVYEVTNGEGLLQITKTVKRNGFLGDVLEFTNIVPGEDEPVNPDDQVNPDEPVTPDEPDEPVTPDEPTNPDNPENKDEEEAIPDKPISPQTGDKVIMVFAIGLLAVIVFVATKGNKLNKGKHF